VGGFHSRSFDSELGSQSHRGYVSRSPPIMPDGQISRVRFETSAFFRGPFQGREVKTLVRIRPVRPWFAPSLVSRPIAASRRFYQAGHPTDEETAKCPEPLCPTLVLPPLERRDFHLFWGRCAPVLAHTGSCATPLWALSSFGVEPRSKSPCRLYAAPAAHGSFPTLSLKIFPWMLDPVPRRSHRVRLPVSSPVSSAFPQRRWSRLPALLRDSRLLADPCFEAADIS